MNQPPVAARQPPSIRVPAICDDPALIGKAAALFERIRGYALTIEESRALIQEALQRWQSQQ